MAKRKYQRKKAKKNSSSALGQIFKAIILILILATVLGYLSFRGWNSKLSKEQASYSSIVNTSMGPIEYATKGEGPIILLFHMEGSGSDNINMLEPIIEAGYKIICPSRPGYLSTPLNNEANYTYQANLFAELLDHLKINQKVTVIGLSAGGPAAIEFAKKYADKCTSLILVNSPASKLKSNDPIIKQLNLKSIPYLDEASDFNSWFAFNLTKYNQKLIIKSLVNNSINASDKTKNEKVDVLMTQPDTKEEILNFLSNTSPKSKRIAGLNNDLKNLNNYSIGAKKIRVSTLIIQSKINQIVSNNHADRIKKTFPKAQIFAYEGFGHAFWLSNDRSNMNAIMLEFLKNNTKRNVKVEQLSNDKIVGITWVNKTDGALLQLKADGSFSLDFPSVDTKKYYQGNYSVVDNQISFTYDTSIELCTGISGVYNYKMEKDQLILKPINDDCKIRKSHFSEGWFKI